MGKAYSGKKTQVQAIKDKFGTKIQTFNMDEIIREALKFAEQNRAVKEEVPDPKAKAPAKGAKADT